MKSNEDKTVDMKNEKGFGRIGSILGGKLMQKIRRSTLLFISILLFTGCGLLNLSESDEAALDSLRDAGSDFSKIHPFDFYLYHDEKLGAQELCAELRDKGFEVTVREGAIAGEYLCLASRSFIPSIEELSEIQSLIEDLINQYGGEYDGWETIVITE